MAVLTGDELAKMRREFSTGNAVDFTKPDINAALQAIEDAWENTVRAMLSTAIDNAGAFVFTNAQKKAIGKPWLKHKFGKGG